MERVYERHDWICLFAVGIFLLGLGIREKVCGVSAGPQVAESFAGQNLGRDNVHSRVRSVSL